MSKTIQDIIILEKELRLLNDYQGQLVDRTKRMSMEIDNLNKELDSKDLEIARLKSIIARFNN